MKKLFLSVIALMVAVVSFAQNTLVATLSHGETVSMYYGTYALRDAMNAAVSGDVINLSGGAFQAVEINKAITLRGAGIDAASPTFISGDFSIRIASDDANRLSMEGINCTGSIAMYNTFANPYFLKCKFNAINYQSGANIKNAVFANCKITNSFYLRNTSTVQFVNSYVQGFYNNSASSAAATFVNCVLCGTDKGRWVDAISSSQLMNCVVFQTNSQSNLPGANYKLPSTTIATNCVSIGFEDLFSAQAANVNNSTVGYDEFGKVFKDFTGTYSDSQTFELSDQAKTTYLGTDGTQVGLYGGLLPYSSTPTYPQITKMNVAKKTTADGKLSVEIEVSATE